MKIAHLFEWFIPSHAKDHIDDYRRASMIVSISWYGLPFFLINIVKWANMGSRELSVSLTIVMAWVWAMAFVLKYTGSLIWSGNGMLAGLCWHFLFLVYRTGGPASASMGWTLIIPLFAMMVLPLRYALYWIILAGVALVTFFVGTGFGYPFPIVSVDPANVLQEQVTNSLGPFLATCIMGILLIRNMRRALIHQQQSEVAKQKAQNLEALFVQTQRSSSQVLSSVAQLASAANQQEGLLNKQVASMHAMVLEVEEIADVALNLGTTMKHVAGMSQETAEVAGRGQENLVRLEEAMQRMESASRTSSKKLAAIAEKADNITSVVTTITKVADQTNLLSLNAAIEAEKAGEYGRGFTVVATEIRRLADQTAVATLDIEQMVQDMRTAVSSGVMEMDKFIAEIRQSVENVGTISMQLAQIIEHVQGLSPEFAGINDAMGQQSAQANHIRDNMLMLSEEMQATTESVKESFSAITQLNEAVEGLQQEMSRFSDFAVT
jgi:methyl-accepting chemotaxis protein